MKIRRELSEKKESYAKTLFQTDPNLSVSEVNMMVKAQFGGMLRLQKVYAIRRDIQSKNQPATPPTQTND